GKLHALAVHRFGVEGGDLLTNRVVGGRGDSVHLLVGFHDMEGVAGGCHVLDLVGRAGDVERGADVETLTAIVELAVTVHVEEQPDTGAGFSLGLDTTE